MKKEKSLYIKLSNIFTIAAFLLLAIYLVDYFSIFGSLDVLSFIPKRNSLLLMGTGFFLLLSDLFDVMHKSKFNIKIGKLSLAVSVIISILIIYLGYNLFDQPIGTCPFRAIQNSDYVKINFR